MRLFKTVRMAVATVVTALATGLAGAQAWPTQPVKVMVPFPAGGVADAVVRLLSENAQKELGQPIVVDNKPGASGRLMQRLLKSAKPDGYTLGYASSTAAVVVAGEGNLDYDLVKDFTPVVILGEFYGVVAVSADLPVNSIAQLVRYSKDNPGKLNYGSFGQGSQNHFYTEQMKYELGLDMLHVPFKGEVETLNALMGKTIQVAVLGRVPAEFAAAKRLKLIAVMAPDRIATSPELPTMRELGHPTLTSRTWFGLYGPAGMPVEAVSRLEKAYANAANMPEVKKRLTTLGYVIKPRNGVQLTAAIEEDLAKYRAIKIRAGIELK